MNANLVYLQVQDLSLCAYVCLHRLNVFFFFTKKEVVQHKGTYRISVYHFMFITYFFLNSGPPLRKPKGRMSYNNYQYSSVWGNDKIKDISAFKVCVSVLCLTVLWYSYNYEEDGGMGTTPCIVSHVLHVPLCHCCLSLLLCCWKHNDDEQRRAHLTLLLLMSSSMWYIL